MLSSARAALRRLRQRGGHRGHDGHTIASASPISSTTAERPPDDSEDNPPTDPNPIAIHQADYSLDGSAAQPIRVKRDHYMFVCVINAKGTPSGNNYHTLLLRERGLQDFDPTLEVPTDRYFCGDTMFRVEFLAWWGSIFGEYTKYSHNVCLMLTYDASSLESWNDMTTFYDALLHRCKKGARPILGTMIVAVGDGEGVVPEQDAQAFATQHDCAFSKISSITGRGINAATCTLVELAYHFRGQFLEDEKGTQYRLERAELLRVMTPWPLPWRREL